MASSANSASATPTGRSARSALIAARGERVAGQQTGLHPPRIGDVRRIARHERARSRSARRRLGHRLVTLQERRGHQRLQPARQVRFVQRDRMGNPRPEMSRRLAATCTRLVAYQPPSASAPPAADPAIRVRRSTMVSSRKSRHRPVSERVSFVQARLGVRKRCGVAEAAGQTTLCLTARKPFLFIAFPIGPPRRARTSDPP